MDQTLTGMNVAILVTDGFEQSELTEPRKALQDAGAQTELVAPRAGKVKAPCPDLRAVRPAAAQTPRRAPSARAA